MTLPVTASGTYCATKSAKRSRRLRTIGRTLVATGAPPDRRQSYHRGFVRVALERCATARIQRPNSNSIGPLESTFRDHLQVADASIAAERSARRRFSAVA